MVVKIKKHKIEDDIRSLESKILMAKQANNYKKIKILETILKRLKGLNKK